MEAHVWEEIWCPRWNLMRCSLRAECCTTERTEPGRANNP
nr:hypothetical protein [Kibdelosporangium sp. MJ126-NF4]